MKQTIWSNMNLDLADWKEFLNEEYPEITDENEQCNIICEINNDYLDDAIMNLDIQLDNDIIIIADLGLWDGRRTGYKIINSGNIKDCLSTECDFAEWYVDTYKNLRCTAVHHDGTNNYLYREFKDNLSDEQIENFLNKLYEGTATNKDITRYTRKIGDKICNVFGW